MTWMVLIFDLQIGQMKLSVQKISLKLQINIHRMLNIRDEKISLRKFWDTYSNNVTLVTKHSIEDNCIYPMEIIKPMSPGFAARRRWVTAIKKHHDLSLCAKTSLSQHLPQDLEEKLSSFQKFVKSKGEEDKLDDHLIVNMNCNI